MNAMHQPTALARAFDATLEAAWLIHPHSPFEARTRASEWLAASNGSATHANRAFAQIITASSAVRVAHIREARAGIAAARSTLHEAQAGEPVKRVMRLVHGVDAALHWVERDFGAAMDGFERALAEADTMPPVDAHYVRLWRAITLLGLGKPALAFRDLLTALEFFRAHHPPSHTLLAFNVGATLLHAGDWEGAESCVRLALRGARQVGMPGFETMCRSNLAYVLVNTNRIAEAAIEIEHALANNRDELMRFRPGDVLTTVAENLIETGHLEEANEYVFNALDDAVGRNYPLGIGTAKWNQGRIAAERGKHAEAVEAWRVALWHLRRHPHMTQFWKTALAVSNLYAEHGDYRRAYCWHRRFHSSYRRWQDTTRDIRFAYSQAILQLEAIQGERDTAEAERKRLQQAKTELEAVNTELQSRFSQIEAIHDELRDQAARDPLTGLLNRRNLGPTLTAMLDRSVAAQQQAIVAMLDLDRFKQFNDQHGHAAGDRLLAAAGQLLREFFRDDDSAFRYGGDEFCIFLPNTNRLVGQSRLEAFALGLAASLPPLHDGSPCGVGISFGLACYPEDNVSAQGLLDIADAALYRAKRKLKTDDGRAA